MGLDFSEGVAVITQGTTDIIAEFWPFMASIVGIYLAFEIMGNLINYIRDLVNDNIEAENRGVSVRDIREARQLDDLLDR